MQLLCQFTRIAKNSNSKDNILMTLKELIAEAHTIVPKISCESFMQNFNNYFVIEKEFSNQGAQ